MFKKLGKWILSWLEPLLFKTLVVIIPLAVIVIAWSMGTFALKDYMYTQLTKPVLTNGVLVTHSQKQLTMIALPSPSVSVTPLVKTAKQPSK